MASQPRGRPAAASARQYFTPLGLGFLRLSGQRAGATLGVEQRVLGRLVQTLVERSRTQHPRGPGSGRVDRRARRERVAYLDNLKLLLVAVIIAGHGALAYGDLESAWPYQDIQEVQLADVTNVTLSALVIPAALFAMD